MVPKSKKDYIIQKLKEECQSCSGAGCSTCKSKETRITIYANSGIPVEYWNKSWKDFNGDPKFKTFVKEQILQRIKQVYEGGESFAFIGNLGVGKSYAACAILRMAIMNDFKVQYIQMSELITNLISKTSEENYEHYASVDFLCIDEYDSRWIYPSEKAEALFGQSMEFILRTRFQNNMPTIVCSNTLDIDDVVSGDFSKALNSLFSKHLTPVYVSGKDFRKNQK